jgi:ABC-type multidrug transport system ATPase subunit
MTVLFVRFFYLFCPIGYVQQEDIFIGTLKVKEHLKFQAMLRMGRSFTTEEKNNRVEQVLNDVSILFKMNKL